jgi:thiol-disulfide isomerase/thioredoxin
MKKTLFGVLALLCLNSSLQAQTSAIKFQPISVGQQLPDSIWNMQMKILNSEVKEATLKGFQKKLIILDFWATWCTSCIDKFALLSKLKAEFGDEIEFLLVNSKIGGDTPEKMMNRLKGYSIPTIVDDQVLKQLFPHQFIPHYIWINQKGKILAITNSKFIESATIKNVLAQYDN